MKTNTNEERFTAAISKLSTLTKGALTADEISHLITSAYVDFKKEAIQTMNNVY